MGRKPTIQNAKKACITFPDEELEEIDEHAENEGKTRSDLIRDAVRQILPNRTSEEIKHVHKKEENEYDEE